MKRKRYSLEFKKAAARLLIIDGLSVAEVAQKLGVAVHLLYRWKSGHLSELEAAGGAVRGGSSPTEMAAEIDRLRKDLAKAERINQILKNGELLRKGRLNQYAFMQSHLQEFDLSEMCEALGLAHSGYYRWTKAAPSVRCQSDLRVKPKFRSWG